MIDDAEWALGLLAEIDFNIEETKVVLANALNRPDIAELSNDAAAPLLTDLLRTDPRAPEIMRLHSARFSRSKH